MDDTAEYDADPDPPGAPSSASFSALGRGGGEPIAAQRDGVIRAVGAVVFDGAGRLLLVQRGHEPSKGLWSVPGGKVEAGESDEQAVRREIAEETGLLVRVGAPVGAVTRGGADGSVFEIVDYDAVVIGAVDDPDSPAAAAAARAADDAADLRWVTRAELEALPVTEGLVAALRSWDRLPSEQ